ncbi:hypothetical protein [Actinacidiphila sp. bgisy145]|uniref:hypothetical protein n=1 Tax=Actinacidiphila sp. bgisy145 TaxID=3413792 RepID=UPI003EBCDA6E
MAPAVPAGVPGPVPAAVPAPEAVPAAVPAPAAPAQKPQSWRAARRAARRRGEFVEPQGCLYALSQPPLMLFLCVVGGLIGAGAGWDLLTL